MLKKYRSDPSHVLEQEEVELNPGLTYEEQPVIIIVREVKRLRNKNVSLVKVLWRNHNVEEGTWEPEETMKEQYPYNSIPGFDNLLELDDKGDVSTRDNGSGLGKFSRLIRISAERLAELLAYV
ncbi:hypothetical protein GQ457_09G000030 [Hibiscus cannabinus]